MTMKSDPNFFSNDVESDPRVIFAQANLETAVATAMSRALPQDEPSARPPPPPFSSNAPVSNPPVPMVAVEMAATPTSYTDTGRRSTLSGELVGFLSVLSLDKYVAILVQHDVDLETLKIMTMDEMKEVGLPVGAIKRIQTAVEAASLISGNKEMV